MDKIKKCLTYIESLEQRMRSATPAKHADSEAGYRQMLKIEHLKAKMKLESLQENAPLKVK